MTEREGTATPAGSHTSVVYVHGMGSQRRYEEVSAVVDSLDAYSNARNDAAGTLRNIKLRWEPSRLGDKGEVAYVNLDHLRPGEGGGKEKTNYRFYEVYWAPITARSLEAIKVLGWLVAQIPRSARTSLSPWRDRQRLRRSALMSMLERSSPTAPAHEVKRLLVAYDDFEGPEARRDYPDGSFRSFLAYLERRSGDSAGALVALAKRWRRSYLAQEARAAFALLTIGLILGLGALAFFELSRGVLLLANGWVAADDRWAFLGEHLVPNATHIAAVAGLVFNLLVGRFLSTHLGDVQLWCTYEETDEKHQKRKAVLKFGRDVLEHVLRDAQCERVVVLAHSLGTAVAMDSLLKLAQTNEAKRPDDPMNADIPLGKIDFFITWGSPIDKIHYFFESYSGSMHRYNRVVEQARGDIGTIPFSKNRKPSVHWVNYWDRADIISGALETPSAAKLPELAVDNVQVSTSWFPAPAAAHSAYWHDDGVIGGTFDMIFGSRGSYRHPPRDPAGIPDYAAQRIGPGAGRRATAFLQVLMLALPWLAVGWLSARWLGRSELASAILVLASSVLAALVACWGASSFAEARRRKRRQRSARAARLAVEENPA